MDSRNDQRRDFLATLARLPLLGAGALAALSLGGCETLLNQIRNRPMRRSLGSLAANDLIVQTYRDAVAAMKALPSNNPRSWTAQANIHLNHCPHANWFFLPWHRAYLLYFEQICRELTGNNGFALPYWNWTCNRQLPAPFLGNASNPLFAAGRSGVPPAALGDGSVGPALIDSILDEPNFILFASAASPTLRPGVGYGSLEATPHNHVHGFVGGVMGGFTSPLDPIFWMHHNMIERIWWDWNVVRGHANTNDPVWSQLSLGGMFVDRSGQSVNNVNVGLFNLAPILSYRFDTVSITSCQPAIWRAELTDQLALKKLLEEGGPVRLRPLATLARTGRLEIPVGRVASQITKLDKAAGLAAATERGARRVLLRVLDVEQPATGDYFVRVFVNLPQADPSTATSDPHYAGSFAFFNDPDGGHAHHGRTAGQVHTNPAFIVDLTATLARLRLLGRLGDGSELSIQLVVVPQSEGPRRSDVLRLGGLELQLVDSSAPAPQPFGEAPPAKR